VLKTGNVLNEGTTRGNASGFHMESLSTLSQLKQAADVGANKDITSADNVGLKPNPRPLSLLDHLVRIIADKQPMLLDVTQEMQSVKPAERIDVRELEKEVRQLRKELGRIASATCRTESGPEAGTLTTSADAFLTRGPVIVAQFDEQLKGLTCAVDAAQHAYKEVARFFGENRAEITVNVWLGFVHSFLKDFDAAVDAHRTRQERAQRIDRRKQMADRWGAAVSARKSDSATANTMCETKANSLKPHSHTRSACSTISSLPEYEDSVPSLCSNPDGISDDESSDEDCTQKEKEKDDGSGQGLRRLASYFIRPLAR